ncbi:hypothetical protein PSTEL_19755 [Paenibacillus stellifer]|uniref:Uncharacterized protein n=1 Tax=Paenibacillus stellifer TaxID=169760 RepID=A0A089LVU6_9BACL|nr:hypothetical protein [Paenibacillus stellifer]AIQ65017.1 hypothetical protein PSTEL_19755 [Paenibacillus stellifer]
MSWIYIVAVIIFALISNANKSGKRKKGNSRRGGMPSFGRGPDENSRRPHGNAGQEQSREARGSGFPLPSESSPYREERSTEDSREASAPAFPERALNPTPDYDTGEGMSMEQPEEDGVEIRQERMRRELQRVHKALDRISNDMGGDGTGPKSNVDGPASSTPSHSAVSPADLRKGLIWAEILGPPRSRNPMRTRR